MAAPERTDAQSLDSLDQRLNRLLDMVAGDHHPDDATANVEESVRRIESKVGTTAAKPA